MTSKWNKKQKNFLFFKCFHCSPGEYRLKLWTCQLFPVGGQNHRSEAQAFFWKLLWMTVVSPWIGGIKTARARARACVCVCARTPEFSFASAECKRTVIHTGGTTEEFLRISLRQKAFDWKLALKTCLVNNHVTFTWLNFLQSQGLQSEQRSCSGLLACSLFRVNWE